MIATWMLYSLLVGAVVAAAAHALSGLLRLLGRPTRWVWGAALVATLALAGSAPFRAAPATLPSLSATETAASVAVLPAPSVSVLARWSSAARAALQLATAVPLRRMAPVVERLSGPAGSAALAGVWAALSALALALFGATALRHHRIRRRSPRARLLGTEVRFTEETGPLVSGLLHPEIVVPRWLVGAPPHEQRMVLAHEEEHRGARDPLLLAGACLAIVLLPWHPAVWWLASRLQLATETDCDARVVRRGAERLAYGTLLISLAGRGSGIRLGVPAIAGSHSHLERRIHAMAPQHSRFKLLRAGALGAVALVATLAACESALPTAAEVAKMDASSATANAQHFSLIRNPEEVDYYVNGVATTAEDATAIPSEDIAAMRVVKLRKTTADGDANHAQIHILTKDAPAAARAEFEKEQTLAARDDHGAHVVVSGETVFDGGERVTITKVDTLRVITVPHGTGATTDGPQPILYIDGVRTNADAMKSIDPSDIQSVEVIKGPAAVRQYGAEAAGGVIRITMKK